MPPTPSLVVATATVHQLQDFLNNAKDNSTLHAKIGKDGSLILYESKGKGTGFKQALFPERFQARKLAARRAVLEITGTNSAEQNAALYASITGGFVMKEVDGANFVVDVAPLIVGDLKSKLSEQIDLHQQALAEKHFKGIELDFDNGKARTAFSAQSKEPSPLAMGLQGAMEGIRAAAHQLSGSGRDKLQASTAAYIKANVPNCPFSPGYEYTQIVDFSLNFDRNTNKLLKEIFDGAPHGEQIESVTMKLAENFRKLKFSMDLFTDTEFTKSCPETDAIGTLGKQLSRLHEIVHRPEGFYASVRALTGLAINSPADFRNYVDKFKSNFANGNLPDDTIVDENGN